MTDSASIPLSRRTGLVFLGGAVVGLIAGVAIGILAAGGFGGGAKWQDAAGAWVMLPDQTALGAKPAILTLPAATFDFGGAAQPIDPAVADAGSIVKVEVEAKSGRVGLSLARPDGGELVSREAIVTPQQGKTVIYLRTTPGAGPVDLMLRSADQTPAGATAAVTRVRTAREADIGKGEMAKINKAGVY